MVSKEEKNEQTYMLISKFVLKKTKDTFLLPKFSVVADTLHSTFKDIVTIRVCKRQFLVFKKTIMTINLSLIHDKLFNDKVYIGADYKSIHPNRSYYKYKCTVFSNTRRLTTWLNGIFDDIKK